MEEQRYMAVSKFNSNNKVILGVWEDVEDLDNRVWDVQPFNNEDKEPEPIAYVEVVPRYVSGDDLVDSYFKAIYTHHDLVGLYV